MKTKTSITLSSALLRGIDEHARKFRSRSEFIEAAVQYFIGHLDRYETERRDLEIINERAEALNEEAEDVLSYQAPL
jgi:metal-responsive CopG/Arc/MetJ family transcriptional regulator